MNDGFKIIIAFVCGFVLAQLIKFLLGLTSGKQRKFMKNFESAILYLTRSGGMPSGHAASFVAAVTMIGLTQGIDSPIFALALCTTAIVIYDAINVRYAVGEHGKLLNSLTKRADRVIEGHTPLEALAGILLGIAVGFAVFAIF